MSHFKRHYILSVSILWGVVVLSGMSGVGSKDFSISYLVGIVVIAAIPLVPIFRNGGVDRNFKLSTCIASSLALGFLIFLGFGFLEFIRTKGSEGPDGSGSPLVIIIAMAFFAGLFVAPWLLTALRGIRLWSHPPQDAVDAKSDSSSF